MYILKKTGMVLLFLLLLALLIAPVGALWMISLQEQAQYLAQPVPVVEELAYGEIVPVRRLEIRETVELSGTVVSTEEFFMELPCKNPYALRFMVSVGEVIHSGDLIAYEGEKELYSTVDGLIGEISLGEDPYLRLHSLQALALECEISQTQRKLFSRSDLALQDENGVSLELLEMGEIFSENGGIRLLLRYDLPGLTYGQQLSGLTLYTGRIYAQTLAVEKSCVYQKSGGDAYYLRIVDEEGHFLREAEVLLGYANEDYVCVSGVEEGELCDAGYGAVWEESYGST